MAATDQTDVNIVLSATLDQFVAGLNEATSKLTGSLESMRVSAKKETSEIDAAFNALGTRSFAAVEADIKEVERAFETLKASGTLSAQEIGIAQQRAGEKIRELKAETSGWAESFGEVKVAALAAVATVAVVGSTLGNAGGAAADFGEKMAEVGTQLSDVSGIPELSEQVRELARTMGGDAVENAQGLYDILSAGVSDPVDAMERLNVANKLAVGGVTDVTVAAQGLNAALNSYGKAAGTASDVADSFFVAAREGATSVAELSQGLGDVAPLAFQAGVSFDELIASVAALTNGGIETSKAFTQVQSILTAVVKPTTEAAKLAESLGINFSVAALKSKGLSGFLAEIAEKTGGSSEKMAVLLGRVEGLQGALSLTGNQAKSFTDTIGALGDKTGAAEKAFKALNETDAAAIRRFDSALKDIQLSLGNAVTALTPLLEGTTFLLNAFNDLPEPIRTVITAIGGLTAVIAPMALAWASLKEPLALLATSVLPQLGVALGAVGTAATASAAGAAALLVRFGPIAALLGTVAIATNAAADALTEYALAQQQAVADADYAIRLADEIKARQAQAEALKEYADVAVLSAEQVAALSATELAAYQERLTGAKAYESAVTGVVVRQKELLGATAATIAATQANAARQSELNQAIADYTAGVSAAANASVRELTPALASIVDKLRETEGESKSAAAAFADLFEGLSASAPAEQVDQIALALGRMAVGVDEVDVKLRGQLGPALAELSGTQLAQLAEASKRAFEEGGRDAAGYAEVLDSVVVESLRKLGADAITLGVSFTDAGTAAIGAFNAIGTTGKASAQQVLTAFKLALAKLQTPQEIESLIASLRRVGPEAGVGLHQMEAAANAAAAALLKIKVAQGEINEEVLRSQIRKLEDQYTALIKTGTATAAELAKVRQELAGLNDDLSKMGDKGAQAGRDIQDGADNAADSLKNVGANAQSAGASVADAGDSAEGAAGGFDAAAAAMASASSASISLATDMSKMSDAFADAANEAANASTSWAEYADTMNSFVAVNEDQLKFFESRLEVSQRTIDSMDEEAAALALLRKQYSSISDNELRRLYEAEKRAAELREEGTQKTKDRTEAERELRKEIEQTSTSAGGGGINYTKKIEIELKVTNTQSNQSASTSLTQSQIREIAARVIEEIKRDQNL